MRGRPIHRQEGQSLPFIAVTLAQCPCLPELCWSDQGIYLYPVRPGMQEHRGYVTIGDISEVDFMGGPR